MPRKRKGEKSVLLTGTRTFLFRGIVPYLLEEGKKVVAIDKEKPENLPSGVHFYRVDLTLPTADTILSEIFREEGVEEVIHLAFLEKPKRDLEYAHEFAVIGTLHLLHACASQGVKKIVATSTTMVYGASPENPHYLSEEHPLKGVKGYAWIEDRIEVEKLLLDHKEKYPSSVTILRLAPTIGPQTNNLFTYLFSRPIFFTILGFDPLWQLLHEEDGIQALYLAYHSNHSGVFNIVGEGVLPLSTLIYLAGQANIPLPKTSLKEIYRIGWMIGFSPFPPEGWEYFQYVWLADGEKAKKMLSFMPKYTTRKTIEEFSRIKRGKEIT